MQVVSREKDLRVLPSTNEGTKARASREAGTQRIEVEAEAFRTILEGSDHSISVVEIHVRLDRDPPVDWYCWEARLHAPHDLRTFEIDGAVYACYGTLGNLRFFRIQQGEGRDAALERLLDGERTPGELPKLAITEIDRSVGLWQFRPANSLYRRIVVDEMLKVDGELRAVLCGDRAEGRFTFALRGEEWVYLPGRTTAD